MKLTYCDNPLEHHGIKYTVSIALHCTCLLASYVHVNSFNTYFMHDTMFKDACALMYVRTYDNDYF